MAYDDFEGDRAALDRLVEQHGLPPVEVVRASPAPALLSVEVPEEEVERRAEQFRAAWRETGFWPLLVDPSDYDEDMPELVWDHEDDDGLGFAAVAQALGLELDSVIEADDEEVQPPSRGTDPPAGVDFVGVFEYLPFLLLVPAAEPWLSLAVVGAGGTQTTCTPAAHAVVARWLDETIGAVPVEVGVDRVGFLSDAGERASEGIVEVARRLNSYRPTTRWTPSVIAEQLTGTGPLRLRFWWD